MALMRNGVEVTKLMRLGVEVTKLMRVGAEVFSSTPPGETTDYTVDWTALAAGTEIHGGSLPTGWGGGPGLSGRMDSEVVVDGASEQGQALNFWAMDSGGSPQLIWPTAVISPLTAATARVQILTKTRLPSNVSTLQLQIPLATFNNSAALFSGAVFRATGSAGQVRLYLNESITALGTSTQVGAAVGANTVVWCRCEWDITGLKVKARQWLDGEAEPGTWTERAWTGLTITNGGIGGARESQATRVFTNEWLSYGFDADAPGP